MVKVSIIILNYNTSKLLEQTINSIKSKVSHEIIVVDNASTDDSVAMVKKHFPKVRLLALKANKGFAAGNNAGAALAKGEYLMLLNSDTEFTGEVLQPLIDTIEENSNVAAVTPKLIFPSGEIDWGCHRGLPTVWNSFTYFARLEKTWPQFKLFGGYHQTWKDLAKVHTVEVISGAAFFIKHNIWQDLGGLDERFFMYAEDIDLCLRIKKAGYQIMYQPQAKVIHHKGQSGTKHQDRKLSQTTKQHFYSTMKQYWDKHYAQAYPKIVSIVVHKGVDILAKIRN